MPRTGKGGKREGSSQKAYANRTDLNNRGPEPITVAPGQTYGEGEAQRLAQQAVPMSAPQMPAVAAPQMFAAAAPQINAGGSNQLPHAEPGTIPFLEPSDRPDEPVTHGLSRGPGGGNEVMGASLPSHNTLLEMLLAASKHPSASEQVKHLAELAKVARL